VVIGVLVVIGIVAGTVGTGRHRRRTRRRTGHARPRRATVVGVLVFGAILGATVAGGALVRVLVHAVAVLAATVAGWLG
jgi:hypothetical protein